MENMEEKPVSLQKLREYIYDNLVYASARIASIGTDSEKKSISLQRISSLISQYFTQSFGAGQKKFSISINDCNYYVQDYDDVYRNKARIQDQLKEAFDNALIRVGSSKRVDIVYHGSSFDITLH